MKLKSPTTAVFEVFFCLCAAVVLINTARAAVPQLINYQGRLTTATGEPVADGAYFIRFQIYDAATAGTSLWNSGIQAVIVSGGAYTYVLGKDVPLPDGLFGSENRWLGITVGIDPEMTPRSQLLSSVYSFVSQNADSVDWNGIRSMPAGFADGIDDNSGDITAVNTSGGLTGGVTSGDANLSLATGGVTSTHIANSTIVDADIAPGANISASKINGTLATLDNPQTFTSTNHFDGPVEIGDSTMRATGAGIALGRNLSPSGTYLLESRRRFNTTSSRYGNYTFIENAGTGALYANYARAEATTLGDAGAGFVVGTYSHSESDNFDRYGSYSSTIAQNRSITTGESFGAFGSAQDGADAYGIYGEAKSSDRGYGVFGIAEENSGQNIGVYGRAIGGDWLSAVYAWANSSAAVAHGVRAVADVTNGSAFGLLSTSYSSTDFSVASYCVAETNSGEAYGVWADAEGLSATEVWAGKFLGDVDVFGTIFSPVFVEKIDHPIDPTNKNLHLTGVVSHEMTNIAHGNVTTDPTGLATVSLPDYFTAISTDFRYQLTVVGQFAQAIIDREIEGSSFVIRTDKPEVKVSWLVTALRDDPYSRAHPTVVEADKRAKDLGLYLHPEAYGLGPEFGVNFKRREEMRKRRAEEIQATNPRAVRPGLDPYDHR